MLLDKIATEIRNLQRTEIGEVEEPLKKGQLGSSAVSSKKEPLQRAKEYPHCKNTSFFFKHRPREYFTMA